MAPSVLDDDMFAGARLLNLADGHILGLLAYVGQVEAPAKVLVGQTEAEVDGLDVLIGAVVEFHPNRPPLRLLTIVTSSSASCHESVCSAS